MSEQTKGENFIPTLYYYDHCPYCVRVLLFASLAKLELNHHILLNDDEATPIGMVGAKMVPILEYKKDQFMGESLDIIEYLSEQSGVTFIKNSGLVGQVDDFLVDAKLFLYKLMMPRWPKMPFKEFATQSAIDYFTKKKTQMIGDFDLAESETEIIISKLNEQLEKHQSLFEVLSAKPANTDASIMLFSALNGLYCVKDLVWTEASLQFMSYIKKQSGINTPEALAI